jgi:hypothetical protein
LNPRKGGIRLKEQLLEKAGKKPPTQPTRIVDPPDGQVPYQEWARAKQQEIQANIDSPTAQRHIDPQARCLPNGPLRSPLWSTYEIMQSPGYLVFSYETTHMYRIVPLDGRPHPSQNVKLWMGDSRGHWEGNTLVVDSTNFTARNPFHGSGDRLHVVERFTRVDADTILYRFTVEDPETWDQPWTAETAWSKVDGPIFEYACHEGNYSLRNTLHGARVAEENAEKKAGK